jgi:hypothetical protein
MFSLPRNGFCLTLVAFAALALFLSQPVAFACQMQTGVLLHTHSHANCAHDVQKNQHCVQRSLHPKLNDSHAERCQHTSAHYEIEVCTGCVGAAQHHTGHPAEIAATSTHLEQDSLQSSQQHGGSDTRSCRCAPAETPDGLPTLFPASFPQNDLAVPAAAVSLTLPRRASISVRDAFPEPRPFLNADSLSSRAPPQEHVRLNVSRLGSHTWSRCGTTVSSAAILFGGSMKKEYS